MATVSLTVCALWRALLSGRLTVTLHRMWILAGDMAGRSGHQP